MVAPTQFLQPYAADHQNPNGEGDARPTAMKIIEDQNLVGAWKDRVVLITGCNTGIGLETARALHATGAKLFITTRTRAKGEPVVKDILSTSPSQTPISILELELDSLASVRAAAASFLAQSPQLHVLIANAGIMASPQGTTQDGFESQLGVCHLAHFLLFQLLKPALLAAPGARVVTVSSSGHKMGGPDLADPHFAARPYDKWAAYAAAKTANIWMATALDRRFAARGLRAFAVHPGAIFTTDLSRHLADADMALLGEIVPDVRVVKDAAQGAATQVWCATAAELEGAGGLFCADCGVARPMVQGEPVSGSGFAPHAYDDEGARGLWEFSCDAVGVERD